MELFNTTSNAIGELDLEIMQKAQERLDYLLKPQGSLGKLEDIARQLSGITGKLHNNIEKKTIIVMASDNGVFEESTSSFPQDVSFHVADTMTRGISGVAVLAKHANAELKVIDIGLANDTKINGSINKKIRKGTSNIAKGPAMSREEAIQAIEIGIEITNQAIADGANIIGTGEVGICNTTTSSAILHAFSQSDLDKIVGRGAGLDDEGLQRKKAVIKKALEINQPDINDPVDVLAKLGGFDIAGLTGCYLAAAAKRIPVIIDGFISGVAALVAVRINPKVKNFMLPSHGTLEPGRDKLAELLGIEPMLEMNMRLGEGTGCALAFHIIEAATKIMNEMGTFGDIGM